MNLKNKEGSYYASKVRLFLNEYGGIDLQEFCKAEKVSYTKMCHCLGRPSYRKPKEHPSSEECYGIDRSRNREVGVSCQMSRSRLAEDWT